MSNTFTKKDLRATVVLDGGTTYTLSGFAMSCSVEKQGGAEYGKASLSVSGLSLTTMSQLTWLSFLPQCKGRNTLQIDAGDSETALSTIFRGDIMSSIADLNGSEPTLKIEAQTGAYGALIPATPQAVQGEQEVAVLIQSWAKSAGAEFKNEGVSSRVKDSLFEGNYIDRARKLAHSVGADLIIDDNTWVLVEKKKTRTPEGGIPLINKDSGMIGYPTFTSNGLDVKTYFRPDIQIGATVRVESMVPRATGTWKVTSLSHALAANNPSTSQWETDFSCQWLEP